MLMPTTSFARRRNSHRVCECLVVLSFFLVVWQCTCASLLVAHGWRLSYLPATIKAALVSGCCTFQVSQPDMRQQHELLFPPPQVSLHSEITRLCVLPCRWRGWRIWKPLLMLRDSICRRQLAKRNAGGASKLMASRMSDKAVIK